MSELRRSRPEDDVIGVDEGRSTGWVKWVFGLIIIAVVAAAIGGLLWYSNNQNENETNPWKNGTISKTSQSQEQSSSPQSVDTSSLTDNQLKDWVISTYAKEQGSTGEEYKDLGWQVYSWTDNDGLVYAQLYDSYGNDVLLFRVTSKGQLEAYGGLDGSSGSWETVSKTYTSN